MMYRKKPMEEKLPWNLFWQNKQKLPYKSTCNTLIRMGVFPLCCCYFFLLCFDLLLAFFTVIFLFHYLCTILYCWPLLVCFCVHVSISLLAASPYCDVLSSYSYLKALLSKTKSLPYAFNILPSLLNYPFCHDFVYLSSFFHSVKDAVIVRCFVISSFSKCCLLL